MTDVDVQPTFFDASTEAQIVTAPAKGRHRRRDPETSRAAAEAQTFRSGGHKARILAALFRAGAAGLTDFELFERTGGARVHVAGTRRGELKACGLVRETALTRPTDTGEAAIVHVLTPRGLEVARAIVEGGE